MESLITMEKKQRETGNWSPGRTEEEYYDIKKIE